MRILVLLLDWGRDAVIGVGWLAVVNNKLLDKHVPYTHSTYPYYVIIPNHNLPPQLLKLDFLPQMTSALKLKNLLLLLI